MRSRRKISLLVHENLSNLYDKCSTNGPKVLLGDWNARMGKRRPGEDDVLDEQGWGREAIKKVEISNRDLLMQFCLERDLAVANALKAGAPETKATFVETGVAHMSAVADDTHSMLDLALAVSAMQESVQNVRSSRAAALQTNHFLVTCDICVDCDMSVQHKALRKDSKALKTLAVA
eukprot:6680063-Pyramimonas_sp.AAC.1